MTAYEVLTAVEQAGGVLMLKGDLIGYDLPENATHLLPELQEHRDEILSSLKNLAVKIEQWITGECVATGRCSSNPRIMHREFVGWSGMRCSEASFLSELARNGFALDGSGMIAGLALAADLLAAIEYERSRLV
jgi:hypothetical protein